MRLGDFGSDMQSESQAVPASLRLAAKERLKQRLDCRGRDRLAAVGDPKFQLGAIGRGMNPDGLVGRSIGEAVGEQI